MFSLVTVLELKYCDVIMNFSCVITSTALCVLNVSYNIPLNSEHVRQQLIKSSFSSISFTIGKEGTPYRML